MLKVYPALFHIENDSYWVEFPDLPGCQSVGDTLEETIKMAQEALGLYLNSLLEDKVLFPPASDIKSFASCADFTSYISVDIEKYFKNTKSVKKTLSIPGWLNEEAEKRHINFSSTLQEALKQHLNL